MSDVRNMQDVPFAMVERDVLQNDHLSLKAKGLYALMVSYPKDWTFNLRHLSTVSTDAIHATRSAFTELAEAGLVVQRELRDANGKFNGTEYVVTGLRLSAHGKPAYGKSAYGKSQPTNKIDTNKQSTNKQKNNLSQKESIKKLRDAYNQNRGRLPEALASGQRDTALAKLIKNEGLEAAITKVSAATAFVASDSFWVENKYGLTNLLRHLDAKFEAARTQEETQKPVEFTSLADQILGADDV